mgnify:CR=1 FL=1
MENFKIDVDSDGIALVTFDVPGRSMNTLTSSVMKEIPELVERIKTDEAIKGAVITSGKASGFCAGADLGDMAGGVLSGGGDLQKAFDAGWALNGAFRALETSGKPIAAAINGLALGGGLEFTLATHYRVVENDNKIQLGLPEIKVGLFPGGGGTQRLTRLIGVQAAMMAMSEGKSFRPNDAKGAGIVHEVVEKGQSVEAAKAWIKNGGKAVQPWDDKSFKLPGGGPYHPAGIQNFMVGNAMLRKQSYGNYPAVVNLMKAVYEGAQVPMDAALRIETRYFIKTLMTPQAQAMIRSLFLSKQELDKGAVRPAGVPKSDPKKVTVIGAGMMGAGIAYVFAKSGAQVVLKDVSLEAVTAEMAARDARDARGEHDPEVRILPLRPSDAGEVLTIQRAAFVSEAQIYGSADMSPLTQTLAEVEAELEGADGWVARIGGRLVGVIRTRTADDLLLIGRIAIAPDMQGAGIGRRLLAAAEESTGAAEAELFTGSLSEANLRLYRDCGYVETERVDQGDGTAQVFLRKRLRD